MATARNTSTKGRSSRPQTATGKRSGNETASRKTARRTIQGRSSEDLITRTSDYRQQKRVQEDVFASTIQKANEWLKEVMEEIGTEDKHRGYLALRSVLQTLRDRLPVDGTVHLGAQLPTLIRGVFYEGWVPSGKPIKYSKEEFISCVAAYFGNLSGINHQEVIQAVFRVLENHISEGELENICATLPQEFSELWPETAGVY